MLFPLSFVLLLYIVHLYMLQNQLDSIIIIAFYVMSFKDTERKKKYILTELLYWLYYLSFLDLFLWNQVTIWHHSLPQYSSPPIHMLCTVIVIYIPLINGIELYHALNYIHIILSNWFLSQIRQDRRRNVYASLGCFLFFVFF